MINISYFYDLLKSTGNRRRLSTCGFIFRANAGAHNFTNDWSYWSSGLIYVSESQLTPQGR